MTDRGATIGCLLLGGLLGLVATAQPWWRAAGGDASVEFTGTEASGGLTQALPVVSLAGTLLVLVLQARGRRVVAVLLAGTGLGVAAAGLVRLEPGAEAVRTKVRQVSLTEGFELTATVWPWLYAVAGLLVVAGAALLWRGAPTWTRRADRFTRPGVPDPAADTATGAEDDPASVWRALDAGLDPTVPHDDQLGAEPPADGGSADRPDQDAGTAAPAGRPARPDVSTADSRGHNGEQDHTDTPVRSASRTAHPLGRLDRPRAPKETDG